MVGVFSELNHSLKYQLVPVPPQMSSSSRCRELGHCYEHIPHLILRKERRPCLCFKVMNQKRSTSHSLMPYWLHLTVRKAEKSHLKWEVMCQWKVFLEEKRGAAGGGYIVVCQDEEQSIEDHVVFAVESRLTLSCHFSVRRISSRTARYQLLHHLSHGLCDPKIGNICCSQENLHDSIHFIEVGYSGEGKPLFKTSAPLLLFFPSLWGNNLDIRILKKK